MTTTMMSTTMTTETAVEPYSPHSIVTIVAVFAYDDADDATQLIWSNHAWNRDAIAVVWRKYDAASLASAINPVSRLRSDYSVRQGGINSGNKVRRRCRIDAAAVVAVRVVRKRALLCKSHSWRIHHWTWERALGCDHYVPFCVSNNSHSRDDAIRVFVSLSNY